MDIQAFRIILCPLSEYCFHKSKSLRWLKVGQYVGMGVAGVFSLVAWKAHNAAEALLQEKSDKMLTTEEYWDLRFYKNLVIGAGIFVWLSFASGVTSSILAY